MENNLSRKLNPSLPVSTYSLTCNSFTYFKKLIHTSKIINSSAVLLPLKTYTEFSRFEIYKSELNNIGGVYGFVNLIDGKQYIGSSFNLYERMTDHIKGVSSNIRLKRSIYKYGLENFHFLIYYYHTDPSVTLTDVETEVIKSFPFEDLYNFKKEASSSLGYKHTAEAIQKMKKRLADKTKHPMYGKKHTLDSLKAISKPGKLNPIFNKKHTSEAKKQISDALSKRPIGLYDTNNNLLKTFKNQVELASEYNLFKGTIGRYLKTGKLFLGQFFIREINNKK
jgi:group I intron endonuclease